MAHPSLVEGQAKRRLAAAVVTVETGELLQRLSATLRSDIGPAIGDEYTRTQAYMASVILARVAKQVALEPDHRAAEQADVAELLAKLDPLTADAPAGFTEAVANARTAGTIASFGPVIETLYAWGVDNPTAAEALAATRRALRRDIDRRMEIAT